MSEEVKVKELMWELFQEKDNGANFLSTDTCLVLRDIIYLILEIEKRYKISFTKEYFDQREFYSVEGIAKAMKTLQN